ncbi:MAG TPA: hypothetical protein VGE41_11935 [Verrucomicrobiae bacterium]|jgi:Spy/CpxP family protein refolding chaperone
MKFKKALIASLAVISTLAIAIPFSVSAADNPDKTEAKPERPRVAQLQEQLKRVATELNLTDEQKAKIRPIVEEEFKKIRDVRQDQNLSRQERLARNREIRKETSEKIKPILTAEQTEKWEKIRANAVRRRENAGNEEKKKDDNAK